MAKLVNRAYVNTATTGTGTITLGSALAGQRTFADAGINDGDVVRYVIEDGINFEIGTGTYTASGTTLTRTVSESSNADAALNLTGSAVVYVSPSADDIGNVEVQDFTTVGTSTWTKPVWAKWVKVIVVGGGGGGGSGRRGATTTARCGGAGAGGAAIAVTEFLAADLPATVSLFVASGGSGGAAATTDSTSGNPGVSGQTSLFTAPVEIRAPGGNSGFLGGTSASVSGGFGGGGSAFGPTIGGSSFSGGTGGTGRTGSGDSVSFAAIVGGGGGGGAAANSTTSRAQSLSSFTGLLSGGASGDGISSNFGDTPVATGGSGGGYTTATAGDNGANGGSPGGGGGGGGASDNGFDSGAGGDGGDGMVRVISYS